jgi:hypothetical protein
MPFIFLKYPALQFGRRSSKENRRDTHSFAVDFISNTTSHCSARESENGGKSQELEERNQNELARYGRMPQNGGQRGCAIEQPVPEVRFNQNDCACERS